MFVATYRPLRRVLQRHKVNPREVDELSGVFENQRTGSHINYNKKCDAFNVHFLFRNYLKCLFACLYYQCTLVSFFNHQLEKQQSLKIYDLGCGSAPFSLALANSYGTLEVNRSTKLHLIDKSDAQLERACELAQYSGIQTIATHKATLPLVEPLENAILLVSFVICENYESEEFYDWLEVCLRNRCLLLLVDFPEVVEHFSDKVATKFHSHTYDDTLCCPDSQKLWIDLIGQHEISVSGGVFGDIM